jgi:succinate dehydrogenase / fumarate reductase iron-sulfur subunit
VIRDLVVDRGALDRIVAAGGYISVSTGSAPEANSVLVPKQDVDAAMDAAACIGCGACVAACPNGSASLFTGAKISHLGLLPQGQPERFRRALSMVTQMDLEHFGHCTLYGECQEACPKEISIDTIARMNRDFLRGLSKRPAGAARRDDGA